MGDNKEGLISIQEVSGLLKVSKPTLRFWGKEFDGILMPMRTRGGQRRYTAENIAVIEEIKKLKKRGMNLPEIKRELGKAQMSEAGSQTCSQRSLLRGGRGTGDERTDRIDLLTARAAEVVRAEVITPATIYVKVVIPAKAGIRAPGSRRDLRGESPLSGDVHSR
ncbi:MAG: MerR family transcriptional regulator [Deltaproteobacteria bacterium]|nr:MerR family transcriptional regulator [Deltaproteobacteria bacterium]